MALAHLGVCYYPEHWPRNLWSRQAALIAEAGISHVRIAEFAWSRIEPRRGEFQWDWLDDAVDTLAGAGLKIIMCTPTACPPRWLVEEDPKMLPVAADGRTRDFGSRRHYRFASASYRNEARRISEAVIHRYAHHPAVAGWQTDNEYGCHDTTRSFAEEDLDKFQFWLRRTYESIEALNQAWGTVFWSQEYADFSEVGLPNSTVTEANPAHWMDYYRFASDEVASFNRIQVNALRASAGADRWVTHNFMGNFIDFDHFKVGRDLDLATWDSYPLGFLDQGWFTQEEKLRYRRIGHPDWAAFHHDLYRAVGRGRFGVMEQQPGPVNWARSNAQPLDSAPAFWAMEAIAHGAELVSFFRFQQYPRAQEQMHAGLRLPNGDPAPAWNAVAHLREDLAALEESTTRAARVALMFDYATCWSTEIQPHAPAMAGLRHAFAFYAAVRALGVDVDIVPTDASLEPFEVVLIPGIVAVSEATVERIKEAGVCCVISARSGSRDAQGALPANLPPGALQTLVPVRVEAVDSMRRSATRTFTLDGNPYAIEHWYETLATDLSPRIVCDDGEGFWYAHNGHHYLNGRVSDAALQHIMSEVLSKSGVDTARLPEGLRRRCRGDLTFVFNFAPESRSWREPGKVLRVGADALAQGEWAVWGPPT